MCVIDDEKPLGCGTEQLVDKNNPYVDIKVNLVKLINITHIDILKQYD